MTTTKFQLDEILEDIVEEKCLHPNIPESEKDEDAIKKAWERIAKRNNLTVHDTRSIFKVLQNKYELEKCKPASSWKLFNAMDRIYKTNKIEIKEEIKSEPESDSPTEDEEEEYVEFEVVQDDEEETTIKKTSNATSGKNGETKSSNNEFSSKLEKDDNNEGPGTLNQRMQKLVGRSTPTGITVRGSTSIVPVTAGTAAALQQKKDVILRKSTPSTPTVMTKKEGPNNLNAKLSSTVPTKPTGTVRTVVQLPESLKRKLTEENSSSQTALSKKMNLNSKISTLNSTTTTTNSTTRTTKREHDRHQKPSTTTNVAAPTPPPGISLITIPGNPTNGNDCTVTTINGNGTNIGSSSSSATVAGTTNGLLSPQLADFDFANDMLFDNTTTVNGNGGGNIGINILSGTVANSTKSTNTATGEIINLGNFENVLPPTFFRNLCNSSRHEAFGLYVANVMNRLGVRASKKLELNILRAIIDIQSEEMTS